MSGATSQQSYGGPEVIMVHGGEVEWQSDEGNSITLPTGDTFTVPRGMHHALKAKSAAEIFLVRGGANAPTMLSASA